MTKKDDPLVVAFTINLLFMGKFGNIQSGLKAQYAMLFQQQILVAVCPYPKRQAIVFSVD